MKIIIGKDNVEEINELNALGLDIITFSPPENLDKEISSHADINVFNFGKTIIVNEDIYNEIGEDIFHLDVRVCSGIHSPYPYDIPLNCARIGSNILCNSKFVSAEIIELANESGIRVIHTNQGYSGCSICVLNNNAVITDDSSIACLLKKYQIDVLLIQKGYVHLSERHYGFIGGACGLISDDKLYFSGDISHHPDYNAIINFLDKHYIEPIFNKSRKLRDFGKFIPI